MINPTALAPNALPPALGTGVWMQVYRGKVKSRDELNAALARWAAVGGHGILWHGFTHELDAARFTELATLAAAHGLASAAAYGLDSSDPLGKARRIAAVANLPQCAFVAIDAEGAWEDEDSDKEHARVFCQELRRLAPNAVFVDQPWPLPTYHWTRFPWEEFAAVVAVRCPQYYVNDWAGTLGAKAYATMWPRFDAAWYKLETERLAKVGLVRPRAPTIQGYGWTHVSDLIDCLTSLPVCLMWCEPYPDDVTWLAMAAVAALRARGYVGPGCVAAYQRAAGLTPDGVCGPLTLHNLGIDTPHP